MTSDVALKLALERHGAQVDKGNKPYVGHLLRVAARVADDPAAITVALLHDILEDTETTAQELRTLGFSNETVEAVVLLTKDPTMTYMENIERLKANPLARRVKIADLMDNLDPSRSFPGGDSLRRRYRQALKTLLPSATPQPPE